MDSVNEVLKELEKLPKSVGYVAELIFADCSSQKNREVIKDKKQKLAESIINNFEYGDCIEYNIYPITVEHGHINSSKFSWTYQGLKKSFDEIDTVKPYFKIYQMESNEFNRFWKFHHIPQEKLQYSSLADLLEDEELGYKEVYNSKLHQGDKTIEFQKIFKHLRKEDMAIEKALGNLFRVFNINHPRDFKGHSLSITDIVEINNLYYLLTREDGWVQLTVSNKS